MKRLLFELNYIEGRVLLVLHNNIDKLRKIRRALNFQYRTLMLLEYDEFKVLDRRLKDDLARFLYLVDFLNGVHDASEAI